MNGDRTIRLMNMKLYVKILFLILSLGALAACGRAGPLEPPSASVSAKADDDAEETPKEDRPFILDGILN